MAETLGSLIDKLAIKSIREFYIKKMAKGKKTNPNHLRQKLEILKKQKKALLQEVEAFIDKAWQGKVLLKDEKLKLYNRPETMNKIGKISSISRAIEALTKKNLELWQLEDQARRKDVPLAYIGKIKQKIDPVNQQRNDLIDKIDFLLEKKIKKT